VASLLDTARRQLTAALREAEREVQRLRAALEALGGAGRRQSAKPSSTRSRSRKPATGSVATRDAAGRQRAKPPSTSSAGSRRQPAKRSAPTRGAGGKDTRPLVVFFSSCDARRVGQWEHTTWTDFTDASAYGDDYRKILVKSFSEIVQASKAERTSAQFPCHALELIIYNALGRGSNGPVARSLDRPTNEAWIDPWLRVLHSHGVHLRVGHALAGFVTRHGRIAGARVHSRKRTAVITADWYVCALPVERARRLWSKAILSADPHLGRMWNLDTAWMNGLKFFLSQERPIVRGHIFYVDSPWLVSSFSQAQFWLLDFAQTYGDGRTRESLSAIISDWTAPGVLYGKPARDCTPAEIVTEVWEQMNAP